MLYTEKLDFLLWLKRRKWLGARVEGTLEKGKWNLYDDTDSGVLIAIYRSMGFSIIHPYVYMVSNRYGNVMRTQYIRKAKGEVDHGSE